ncbi:MAG: cupin domain-containing protein [Candidatus Latescibacteria bacterium]|nr:cupin domain-containing protein [Candidatus Latescibacterota bacterium]
MAEPGKRFVEPHDVETQVFDWGTIKWYSEPRVTHTDRFSMGVVILEPGKGHTRHNHPGVEEILYIISGQGVQMVEVDGKEERQTVSAGTMVHIPADVYHETVNTGWEPMKVVAIYCPPGPEAFLRTLPGCRIVPAGELPTK